MKKLKTILTMEDKILMTIAESFPFKFEEIKAIYLKWRSFDAMIWYCEIGIAYIFLF
jgi:hypothetical protein